MRASNTESKIMADWPGGPAQDGTIALLPLGAHEQHGPHLPPDTDTIIAEGIADEVMARLAPGLDVRLLPAEPLGYSVEHADYPETKTLAYDEAIERWLAIAGALHERGCRRLVMLNAHGGNSPLMTIVATEARIRFSMLAVTTSWTRFIFGGDIVSADEKAFGIHGGDIETSVMLALAPERVDMAKTADFPTLQRQLAKSARHLRAYGPHAFGWTMRDLNPDGVAGDASAATAEKGRALIDTAAVGIAELLEDVAEFDLGKFGPPA